MSSLKDNRTSYDFDSQQILALGIFRPVRWLQLGTELGYMTPDIGEGSDGNYPSLEQIFPDVEAPGLIEQPGYLHTTFFAGIDYRDQPAIRQVVREAAPRDDRWSSIILGIVRSTPFQMRKVAS